MKAGTGPLGPLGSLVARRELPEYLQRATGTNPWAGSELEGILSDLAQTEEPRALRLWVIYLAADYEERLDVLEIAAQDEDKAWSRLQNGKIDLDKAAENARAVSASAEFERVRRLPRHDWKEKVDLQNLTEVLTNRYKKPEGTMSLWPVQAAMLDALSQHHNLVALVAVGHGKTLASYLAPLAVGAHRPLLVVPAKLVKKTHHDFAKLAEHWKQGPSMEIKSFEWLGRVQAADFLNEYQPDFIVADEAHMLRNMRAAVTRRVVRYVAESHCKFAVMSGTLANRKLADIHHLLHLTLGAQRMPLPVTLKETEKWGAVVDEKVPSSSRRPCGVLRKFTSSANPTREEVRKGLGLRIRQTPGIIATTSTGIDANIIVRLHREPKPSDKSIDYLRSTMETGVTPDGIESLPSDMYRHLRTCALDFVYYWEDPGPPEWRRARGRYAAMIRGIIDQEDDRYDSELQICNAIDRGELPHCRSALTQWRNIKDIFTPVTVARWYSDKVLEKAIKLATTGDPAIIWVEHRAAGHRLAQLSGLAYYANLGIDAKTGRQIEDHPTDKPLIASIASNDTGRNLQAWRRNVVLPPPSSGRTWEQLIGRTHRFGQLADDVEFEVLVTLPELELHFQQAVQDARYQFDISGQPQKLLLADIV